MKIIKTEGFRKQLAKLPREVGVRLSKQEKIFIGNRLDKRLHLKRLVELEGAYSFRLTSRYRCLFYFQDKTIAVFFAIGHRKDIYRF